VVEREFGVEGDDMQIVEFHPVTPEQFARVVNGLREKGLSVTGTQGEIREFGANVQFEFLDGALKITILSPPHFHSVAQFSEQVREAVQALLAA
jgi:hypothetical protein